MPTPVHLWRMETVNPVDEGIPGGNDGAGSNVSVVAGLIANALDFNGNDSNVNAGDVSDLNAVQKFTIALWMNQRVLDQIDVIFRKRLDAANYIEFFTFNDGDMYIDLFLAGNGRGTFDYSTVVSANTWHHVAVVFDGSQTGDASRLIVYVDAVPITLNFASAIPAITSDLSGLDAVIGLDTNAFDGKLDDFRIYDDALTEADIQALFAHLTPVLDSATNDGDGQTVTLTISNVENPRTVHAFYRIARTSVAFTESLTTRVGPGALSLSGLEDGTTYEIHVISSDGVLSVNPSLQSNSLVVTPSLVTVGDAIALEGQGLRDLQLTDDCSDLEVVNLDLAIVDGTVQIKQALCIALRLFMGEWFLDGTAGVPYYQNVLVKTPDLSEINSILKAEILKVVNVNKILEFSSSFDTQARELSVSFRVDTVFGPVTVEETL